jgi:hypothetical protein
LRAGGREGGGGGGKSRKKEEGLTLFKTFDVHPRTISFSALRGPGLTTPFPSGFESLASFESVAPPFPSMLDTTVGPCADPPFSFSPPSFAILGYASRRSLRTPLPSNFKILCAGCPSLINGPQSAASAEPTRHTLGGRGRKKGMALARSGMPFSNLARPHHSPYPLHLRAFEPLLATMGEHFVFPLALMGCWGCCGCVVERRARLEGIKGVIMIRRIPI